ncbi:MAG: molybdopterin molybdenumtransferase MoeA, partial [Chloroflexi bacterium]|nr:molybdopterin molybdenumtransferase MoeA [Chloroflexota bacterium]
MSNAASTTALPPGSRLLSVEEARDAVLAAIAGPTAPERIPTADGLGRVLAEAVVATTSLPPWANSAMD